jgi:hypothetical protein
MEYNCFRDSNFYYWMQNEAPFCAWNSKEFAASMDALIIAREITFRTEKHENRIYE